jgi:hypothetical protein
MPATITQPDVLRAGYREVVLPPAEWVSLDAGYDLSRFTSKILSVKNLGASAIEDGVVQGTSVPPDRRSESDWVDVDATAFAGLAVGASKSWQVPEPGDLLRFYRLRLRAAGGSVVDVSVVAT